MPERYERLLRVLCIALGGVLLLRIGWVALHHNPLAHLKIPSVPTLAVAEPLSGTNAAAGQGRTNSANLSGTSKASQVTNALASQTVAENTTNASGSARGNTNAVARADKTNAGTNSATATNAVTGTNAVTARGTTTVKTNSIANAGKPATNAVAGPGRSEATNSGPATAAATINPTQPPGMPGKPRDLVPAIQARVDRITDSEILGPVMRPLPMALLGIAGNVAFLRAANGQTGVVKEGEDLGGLKLIRIGINRVLVEQEGQKKELMIFSGLGGESLLTNETKAPP